MKRTSLTEKMVLYFLALGIGSIVITGMFSFFSARKALLDRTYDQLTSIRLARKTQIENFFSERLRETAYYATSETVIGLVAELSVNRQNESIFSPDSNIGSIPDSTFYSGFVILDLSGKVLFKNDPDSAVNQSQISLTYPSSGNTPKSLFMVDYLKSGDRSIRQLLTVCAVKVREKTTAYLALILKSGKTDDFMLEVGPSNGLGYSGETYLVGPDHLMRSQSRFIRKSIMQTPVSTHLVQKAMAGRSGIAQVKDYRGIEVLSSYGPVYIGGLNWAILAEIDYREATSAIYPIRNSIMFLTLITGIAFFIISYMISRSITRPLKKLKDAAVELGEGRLVSVVKVQADDEIGALTEAFNRMAININEKDEALKAERQIRLRSAIDGQDQERQRLSREMHDGIGQSMIAVRLRLGALENGVPEKVRQELQTIIAMADNLIDEVRAISNALMPPALAEFGLTTAIRNLCNNLMGNFGIETSFEGDIPGQLLGKKARLYIFRIFQEALNNVSKHSGATSLKIESHLRGNVLCFSIIDNGTGMDMSTACNSSGHGLNNIRERASLLRGEAKILSSPGAGTTIQIEIPINKNIV
ncbi:MAG: sensor histidine kinase [Bacteroidales bacterium]|nr:sensor histidine kinase [Bacteroidales bacterium]